MKIWIPASERLWICHCLQYIIQWIQPELPCLICIFRIFYLTLFFSDFGYGFFQSWICKFLKFFLRFVFQTLIRTLLYTEVIRAKTTHGKGESHWKTEIGIARSRYLLTRYLSFIIVVAFTWTNFQVILLTCYFHFISSSKTVVS